LVKTNPYKNKIFIEKELYLNFIWPDNSKLILENALNNNSIVCKLNYNNFSCIFTGDIEEIAEKQILKECKNNLNATILKVAHHGSKTSSTQEFIERVNPRIALIGVSKDNKFGHPNEEVVERLKSHGIKIYRTDQMGEITIIVNKKMKTIIRKKIN